MVTDADKITTGRVAVNRITDMRFNRCSNEPARNCDATASENVTNGMAKLDCGLACKGSQFSQTRQTPQTEKANRPQSRTSAINRQVLSYSTAYRNGPGPLRA